MRYIVITRILNSKRWIDCIDSGMEDEMPRLEVQSDSMLLELYHFYYLGVSI